MHTEIKLEHEEKREIYYKDIEKKREETESDRMGRERERGRRTGF